jgi:hypothetical protein
LSWRLVYPQITQITQIIFFRLKDFEEFDRQIELNWRYSLSAPVESPEVAATQHSTGQSVD